MLEQGHHLPGTIGFIHGRDLFTELAHAISSTGAVC
jgi:hypothetical protein